jgi:hypothetical protein
MIGALFALISLDVCAKLVAAGIVYQTFAIASVSATTPIVVTTATPHGFFGSDPHVVISGVVGVPEANGVWEATVIDDTHFSLHTYNHQGPLVQSSGTGAYVSGGLVQIALPGMRCRVGRNYLDVNDAPPRITFVPVGSPAFGLNPRGGVPMIVSQLPSSLEQMTPEQQAMLSARQIVTDSFHFRVRCWAHGTPVSPDFGDFDAALALRNQVIDSIDRLCAGMYEIQGSEWVSQKDDATQVDKRGQTIEIVCQIMQPVTALPLAFVPPGTFASITVEPASPGPGDTVVITTPPVS